MKTGDAWAGARGQLLRAPLDARIHLYHRAYAINGLTRRENGQALHYGKVEDQLDDRDELHHAARWWMRAARSAPGSEISAKARLKALEALPPIARASDYAEQRAREIKLEAVSREIYDKLRAESPKSAEAQRKAAYWSVPALPKSDERRLHPRARQQRPLSLAATMTPVLWAILTPITRRFSRSSLNWKHRQHLTNTKPK